MIHQKADRTMRYFKWGVARLILESEPCPDLVPMWLEGPEHIMPYFRSWPRFVPRVGADVHVTFGDKVNTEELFGDLRDRWKTLREREISLLPDGEELDIGILTKYLKYGEEAVNLRKECTLRVREEVLKVRRSRGFPDEDPKYSMVDTYAQEGGKKREGRKDDGSLVEDA